MRMITVVGARPQFIKAAVVSRVVAATPGVEEILVHTGQHFDAAMSDVFFEELDLPRPDHALGIGGGGHGEMTGRMLASLEPLVRDAAPDWLLVYGDTNSTLAGALAASKLHVPVAHVEAGLRSFNRRMPEEINRVVTDHVSSLLFAPTETAVRNLAREGIEGSHVRRVGDVMLDAMVHYRARAAARSTLLEELGLAERGFALATVHRAENTDDPSRLRGIVAGLRDLASIVPVVLPLHPRTRNALEREDLRAALDGAVRVIDPLGYLDMVRLEATAALVVTDSGGVQKEAYFNGVPCLTMRDETEWIELVEDGANTLVGADPARRGAAARGALGRTFEAGALYGDGRAGVAIVDALASAGGPAPSPVVARGA